MARGLCPDQEQVSPALAGRFLTAGPSGKPQQCFILAILLGVYNDFTVVLRFPGSSAAKESAYNVGDPASIPGLGQFPGEGNGNPLQHSCVEKAMDGDAWWATVHRVAEGCT